MAGNLHIEKLRNQRLYEVEAEPDVVARDLGLDPERMIDFSLNINPMGPPAAAVEAARGSFERANAYPDLRLRDLRRRLAEWHDVPPNWLLFGCGLDEVIKLLVHAWTGEGDRVLIHIPTFPRFELEVLARGATPIFVRSDPPWTISLDAITRALATERPTLAFLCSPNNPTGEVFALTEIAEITEAFPDTLFIVDEALIYPIEKGAVPLVARRRNLAVLRTFSKYWGLAGFRVGYVVAQDTLLGAVETVRPPFNVALLSAAAACAALGEPDYLQRAHEFFVGEVAFFQRALSGMDSCKVLGSCGNMVLIGLEGVSAPNICMELARQGILVADGQSFHGLEDQDTLRISLRDHAANRMLVDTLQAVLATSREGLP
jgi:histidinol-phosphate aminotransferase